MPPFDAEEEARSARAQLRKQGQQQGQQAKAAEAEEEQVALRVKERFEEWLLLVQRAGIVPNRYPNPRRPQRRPCVFVLSFTLHTASLFCVLRLRMCALCAPALLRSCGVFSAHQMGTARMGCNSRRGVCSPRAETYEVRNLFLADTSVFPTPSGTRAAQKGESGAKERGKLCMQG